MDKVKVAISKQSKISYEICLTHGAINQIKNYIGDNCSSIVIVTDEVVSNLYSKTLVQKIQDLGYMPLLLVVKPGEESKCAEVKTQLELEMLKNKCDRHTLMIALGGGVIGDLTGYIAATYMRGISYIQVPTTLLAAIDSSVGGKTGINTIYGKNLIGAIWQPLAVLTDLDLLATLPQIQFINGLIEAIKIFLTLDKKSFEYLERNLNKILRRDPKILISVLKRAVKLKADVVRKDEREENLRMILNFGHTFGHAVEKFSNYEILHGYCVGLGILLEAKIAVKCGYLPKPEFNTITKLLALIGINAEMLAKFDIETLVANMLLDKKNKNGDIYMILLNGIGIIHTNQTKVATKVSSKVIQQAFKELINEL